MMLKLKHLERALRYEARMNELESRPKVGAGEMAHNWKCISPGEYDSLYECCQCGARHMEQAEIESLRAEVRKWSDRYYSLWFGIASNEEDMRKFSDWADEVNEMYREESK